MDLLHCATKYWEKRGGRNYCQPARVCGGQKSGGGDGDHTRYNRLVPQIDPSVPQPVFTITEKAPSRALTPR